MFGQSSSAGNIKNTNFELTEYIDSLNNLKKYSFTFYKAQYLCTFYTPQCIISLSLHFRHID